MKKDGTTTCDGYGGDISYLRVSLIKKIFKKSHDGTKIYMDIAIIYYFIFVSVSGI